IAISGHAAPLHCHKEKQQGFTSFDTVVPPNVNEIDD
ncbi:hypothetical protein EVA_22764, partial [gut metagenome]